MDNIYICHHGVKGMRWGHRKKTISSTRKTHRQKIEEKYMSSGMDKQNAKIQAAKRIKFEKILGVTAGVAVGTAVTAVAVKQYKDKVDKVLNKGSILQRMINKNDEQLLHPFYAAYKKYDKDLYRGKMGAIHFNKQNVHKESIKVNDNIKIASRNNAAKVFKHLYDNDTEFREAYKKEISGWLSETSPLSPVHRLFNTVDKNSMDTKLMKKGYDALNIALVDHNTDSGKLLSSKFYTKMKNMGYDAIEDMNDKKYSGYRAKNPLIIFNPEKVILDKINKVADLEIDSALNKIQNKEMAVDLSKTIAQYGTIGAASIPVIYGSSLRKVNDYKKDHPNTNMTDTEILNTINGYS